MDVESGEVRNVAGFEGAKNISPQWTRDGRSLFFLSDRQGSPTCIASRPTAASRCS